MLAGVGWEHLDTCPSVILSPIKYIYTSTAGLASLVTGPLGRVSTTHEVRGKYLIATKIFYWHKNIFPRSHALTVSPAWPYCVLVFWLTADTDLVILILMMMETRTINHRVPQQSSSTAAATSEMYSI